VKRFAAITFALGLAACATPAGPEPDLPVVDLDRYLGRWYEIASLPQYFQRGCVATTAFYSRLDDGRIRVENQCRDGTLDGPIRSAEGTAWVAEEGGNAAKLKVSFFWPFSGHYWIVALDPEYRWALVGHPERKYLWILSRSPQMDAALYDSLVDRARGLGYDVDRLVRTPQPDAG